jgi:hypothetical protein
MESLIFGLIAVRYIYHREEPVREETEIQPFDVQALRYVYGTTEPSARRSTDRNEPQVAQAAS